MFLNLVKLVDAKYEPKTSTFNKYKYSTYYKHCNGKISNDFPSKSRISKKAYDIKVNENYAEALNELNDMWK